jgi:DNA-binding transcriptional ArsR family regulator
MREACRVFGALADETRLRLVFALRQGELCVCQLIELTGLSPSTVSKHLSLLRDAGWLDSRKQGRWVHYRLADRPAFPMLGKRAPAFFQALEKSEAVREDDRRMRSIRRADRGDLCRKIAKR